MAYICVPLRCGLCRFNIDDGSKVVVVTIDGIFFDTHESSPLVELPDYTYIECADASCERVWVWWETVRLPIAGKIEAHTDSVKLRGLTQAATFCFFSQAGVA
ncbi:hypothetical protein HYQ44_017706 [Verticillium longisporum]|nr:hypothetical protein HYQ44_017706 [Verticillium longisporum]